ncbi:MAG: hypothetical protein JWP44_2689 [Mucilaginibacter sp.]|nr:hypothetical protein [Mucilaginibacter sp.]
MATIKIKYSQLFTLSVMQLFYSNKVSRSYQSTPVLDFMIVPTAECQDFMKARNMIFKNTDTTGGFTVLARTSGTNGAGNDLLRYPVNAPDKLSFFMIMQNPDLVNFDLLPTQPNPGKIYYFSNQVTDAAATRNSLHLSVNAAGVDGSADQIKKASVQYTFNYAGSVTAATIIQVKHLLTGALITPKSVTTQGGQSVFNFDLSVLPLGYCQLLVDGVLTDTFYFLGTVANQQVFGVIELSLSTSLSANYRIVEADMSLVAARPNYIILFKNRQTVWRYTVQLLPTSPLYLEMAKLTPAQKTAFIKQLGMAANDTTILFKLASNTDSSFVFVSAANIALKEKYISSTSTTNDPLIITLSKYITTPAKEAVVKTSLPYPSTSVIDAGSLPTIYSDVFITI